MRQIRQRSASYNWPRYALISGVWAQAAGCEVVVTPYAPAGWTADRLTGIEGDLAARGIVLHRVLRNWDRERWPHAAGGFFAFWAKAGG